MSIPTNIVTDLLNSISHSHIDNLVTQADARRILQEVKEISENYPKFDPALTEKAVHISYTLLSCGCSLVENNDSASEGLAVLEKAGKILSDVFMYNSNEAEEVRDYNLLIAGMALYAAKQYSRAFIILSDIDTDFAVGQMVTRFIKKILNLYCKL